MKKILLMLLIVCLLTLPAQAINGHVILEHDTMSSQGTGKVYLYENLFNDKLIIGVNLKTDLIKFNLKDGYFPAGVPKSQTYDLIIKYNITNKITLKLVEGCKHYFVQSRRKITADESYIKIGAKYKF